MLDFCIARYCFAKLPEGDPGSYIQPLHTKTLGHLSDMKTTLGSNNTFALICWVHSIHKYLFASSHLLEQEIGRFTEVMEKKFFSRGSCFRRRVYQNAQILWWK